MIAHLPESTVRKILERGMQPFTSNTIQSMEVQLGKLAQIREQGSAIPDQEVEDDFNAMAASALDPESSPITAITVTDPAYRLSTERMREIGTTMVAAPKDVAKRFDVVGVPKILSITVQDIPKEQKHGV